jgi:lysophospholipase L1-like esterase
MPHWALVAAVTVVLAIAIPTAVNVASAPEPAEATAPRPVPTYSFAPQADESESTRKVVAVLGDSFAPAEGQPLADYNFTAVAASQLGWGEVLPFGQGGTGYTNPGQADEGDTVYGDRVERVIAASPDVVIVQGGTNDRDYQSTRDAAGSVFAQLKAGLPQAQIVAMGPLATGTLDEATMTPARDAIRDAAAAEGIEFIDPLDGGWLGRDASLFVDGVHPNAEGQRQIADLFVRAMRDVS